MLLCTRGTSPSDATKICKSISLVFQFALLTFFFWGGEGNKVGRYMWIKQAGKGAVPK